MSALARLLRITVPFHQAQMRANRLLYGNLTSLQRGAVAAYLRFTAAFTFSQSLVTGP